MFADDRERVGGQRHRNSAICAERLDGDSQHEVARGWSRTHNDATVADFEVVACDRDRHSTSELDDVEPAVVGDLDDEMVGFDRGVVDDDRAMAAAPDEMASRTQLHSPPAVWAGDYPHLHTRLKVATHVSRKAGDCSRYRGTSCWFIVSRMTRLGIRLDREWSQLRSRPALLRRAAGWAIVEGPLHDLDQILAAVGYQTGWTAANEAAMRRLVARAADDELAARVAIQRILPGLMAVVRRRSAAAEDGLDELIGAAWICIRTFNPDRRSQCIAAALIADADYRAFRSRWRRRCAGERPIGLTPEPPPIEPVETPAQLLRDLFAQAKAAGVPEDELELARRVGTEDISTEQLARELRVTARTVRNRRARVTDRLRRLAEAA